MELGDYQFLSTVIVFFYLLRGVTSNRELLSCSFETSCGMDHTTNSQFYWRRVSGATPNAYTGPSNDHTFGNGNGQYIYAPSSEKYYEFGRRSTLYTPLYRLTSGRGRIEFYYHMYDGLGTDDMGSLDVYVCGDSSPVWTRRRNQGNEWRSSGQVDFTCQRDFRVYIIASRGKYQSDIAIDDLIITDVFDDPTTPTVTTEHPTTKPTTPSTTTQQTTPSTTTAPTTTAPSTTTQRTTPQPPPTNPPINPPTIPPTAAPTVPFKIMPTTRAKTIPSTTKAILTGAWTKSPQESTVTSASKDTAVSLTVTMTTASSLETEVDISVVPDNPSTVGISVDSNLQSGSSSPSFIGPIVVVCIALLLIGLTLCLAFKRKKSTRKPASKAAKEVTRVDNPSYCGEVDSLPTANNKKRANYSYQELLQQQSYSSIDETGRESDVEYHTLESSDTAGAGGDCSYQEIGEKNAPRRRGESALYTAIPDQGGVTNEYSYTYANRDGNGGSSSAAGRSGIAGRAPSEGNEQEYAAIRDPNSTGNEQGAAGSYGMVENQLYIPFKE